MKITQKDQIRDPKPPNRCLYRYRSMHSPELERIFSQREVYCASPITFNDPFDCRPQIIPPSRLRGDQYFRRLIRERSPNSDTRSKRSIFRKGKLLLQDSEHLYKIYEDALRQIGVYCLSEKRDDILMWSHYSEGHKGICLEFDASKEWTLFWMALKVSYSEEYPSVDITKMDNDD